jgi:hypothetical protein
VCLDFNIELLVLVSLLGLDQSKALVENFRGLGRKVLEHIYTKYYTVRVFLSLVGTDEGLVVSAMQ